MEATLFTRPLYVGKASNLRVRYEQHVASDGSEKNVFGASISRVQLDRKNNIILKVADLLFVSISMPTRQSNALEDAQLNELLQYVLKSFVMPPL